jgi:release factor glutamine methyltransferase
MTGAEALRAAIPGLCAAGVPDAPRDARLLLAHALGTAADRLTLHLGDSLSDQSLDLFHAAVAARIKRQPLAQITGQRLFWCHSFRVTKDTLDPRPETECLVAEALRRPFVKLLDLGTGTGCILLSCLAEMPMAQGVGTDVSPQALDVARANAAALGLANRARFQLSNWLAGIDGRFDLITSNPPYISDEEMQHLSPEVRDWEPHLALSPGGDGLDAYRAIATGAPARLLPGGRLLLEIGPTQGAAVCALLVAQGFEAVAVLPDLDGRDRVVTAQKPILNASSDTPDAT